MKLCSSSKKTEWTCCSPSSTTSCFLAVRFASQTTRLPSRSRPATAATAIWTARVTLVSWISAQFGEPARCVKGRVEQKLVRNVCAGQSQTPCQTANRQRLQGRLGRGRDVADHPRSCEQTCLSRVTIRHRDPAVCRVLHHPRAIGVMAHTNGGRADAVSPCFAR